MQELLPGEAPKPAEGRKADALPRLRVARFGLPARLLLAALAGLALSLSLPPVGAWPVAFVAIIPLLWLVWDARPGRGFLIGLAFGVAYFGAVLYWVVLFGELAWTGLVLASAISLGLFGMLSPAIIRRRHPVLSVVGLAALWTAIDQGRGMWPMNGFTWGTVAMSQVPNRALLPLASVTGAAGLTFVIVLVNGLLLLALRRGRARPALALVIVGVCVAIVAWPVLLPSAEPNGRSLSVATIQTDVRRANALGSVQQDRAVASAIVRRHRTLAGDPPDLVVWGESSLDPGATDPATIRTVRDAISSVGAPTLLGAVLPGPGGLQNDAVLLNGEGVPVDVYAKVHLVPFGEYVPWRSWLGWIGALRQIPYDLAPGTSVHTLTGAGLPPIGAIVCYENGFPSIDRTLVREGAQVLVVLTNDASYKQTAESRQQLLMSQLRAVENGRWMIHGAISGISAIIDPTGRVISRTGLFDDAVLRGRIRASTQVTLATRLGDWVPLMSLAIMLGLFILPRRRTRDRGVPAPLPAEPRVLVVLPTFNERATIQPVIDRLMALDGRPDVVVVDDASPDGTGELVREIEAREERVRLVGRSHKSGLASAYAEGFRKGLEEGYDLVVEMDSDLSHEPDELPGLLAAARDADLVIGSRYVPGGSVTNWSRLRLLLSRAGNAYARLWLSLPLRDATSGYRVYRREPLGAVIDAPVHSDGYGFQIELALRSYRAGYRIAEEPITFREREHGHSKISRRIVAEALWLVTLWGFRDRFRPQKPAPEGLTVRD